MSARWIPLLFTSFIVPCCCLLLLLSMPDPLEIGTPAPDFSLPSLDGDTVSLADFAGRPVLLTFWSST